MEEIATSNNQIVELQEDGTWRLVILDGFQRQTLLEVPCNEGVLFYHKDFGRSRSLPGQSWLSTDQVQEVLTGWAAGERCWILGIQLRLDATSDRTRWCEVTRFPASLAPAYSTQAQHIARALAGALGRPLRIIRSTAPDGGGAAPPRPAPPNVPYSLPVVLPNQLLRTMPGGLRLTYTGKWMFSQIVQAVFYLVLSAVFGFVSSHSINTPYAQVHQSWLPLVGLGLMLVLAVMSLWQARKVLRTNDIVIHKERGNLYYFIALGHWLRIFRRRARPPIPLKTIDAVVVRNLTPGDNMAEWMLFLQAGDEVIMLSHMVNESTIRPSAPVQAAAAIADLLDRPLRIIMQGVGDNTPRLFKCETCGAVLTPEQLSWSDAGEMHCTFCGAALQNGQGTM